MRLFHLLPLLFPALACAEPVQIPGPNGPLEAELTAAETPSHAVIIIPGSGPTNRDGNAPQTGIWSDSYKLLAEGLASRDITALRIDKRGFYGSSSAISNPNDVTIGAYAQDARDWVDYAAGLAPCVWIAGHSEGGLVGLVAAKGAPDSLCGLILLAAPGRPVGQLLAEQLNANPANAPLMPEIEAIIADLENGKIRDPGSISPVLQPLFAAGVQRYMTDLFSYDPAEAASHWQGPVLIVQPEQDLQVREADAGLLQDALPQARRVDLPGATHMLKADVPGQPFATYTDRSLPLHEALLPAISTFLKDTSAGD